MAIKFNEDYEFLVFDSSIGVYSDVASFSYWIRVDGYPSSSGYMFWGSSQSTISSLGRIAFTDSSFYAFGRWYANAALSTGSWHHVAITHDHSNTANKPSIYYDGASQTVVTQNTPEGNADYFGITRIGANTVSFNGAIQDFKMYDKILSSTEIYTLALSRLQKTMFGGLVIWIPMMGASGCQVFDGTTLGSSNSIVDVISGSATSNTHGSPVGEGSVTQTIGGNH